MTPERRAELKRLCEAATEGPWETDDCHVFADDGRALLAYLRPIPSMQDRDANAAFIAAARTALPELLDYADRLEERMRSLEADVDMLDQDLHGP